MKMTPEEYKGYQARLRAKYNPAPNPNKYRNIKCEVDGIKFQSKAEAHRYLVLKDMQLHGEIIGFGLQPSFRVSREVRYVPDFIVCDKNGITWVEDVKSPITAKNATFVVKSKLFREKYPWLELRLIN